METVIECNFIEIDKNTLADNIYTKNIIVGTVYRLPGTNISEFIDCLIQF